MPTVRCPHCQYSWLALHDKGQKQRICVRCGKEFAVGKGGQDRNQDRD